MYSALCSYYRKHVNDFAKITRPLANMLPQSSKTINRNAIE